jgi:hypothetical protein
MDTCPVCNSEIESLWVFCPFCGSELPDPEFVPEA